MVLAQPGLILRDRAAQQGLPAARATSAPRSGGCRSPAPQTVVDYKSDAWHRYRPGGLAMLNGDGAFRAPSGTLTLVMASGNRVYRDRLVRDLAGAGSSTAGSRSTP